MNVTDSRNTLGNWSWRRALHALLPGAGAVLPPARTLVLQHLGFDDHDLPSLQALLDAIGSDIGCTFSLDAGGGEAVLAEQSLVAHASPVVLHAWLEGRALVTLPAQALDAPLVRADDAPPDQPQAAFTAQLASLFGPGAAGRRDGSTDARAAQAAAAHASSTHASSTHPPSGPMPRASTAFDSAFDSRQHGEQLVPRELDPDRATLLNALRRGMVDPKQPPLVAGYGAGAVMAIDFLAARVTIDSLADQRLRILHELPYRLSQARPGVQARLRPLDSVCWDIALAAGDFRLLHSPVNWWRARLEVKQGADFTRYTRHPKHLSIVRCLSGGPVSPADLRRRARVSLADLRGFLQAGLFLGLLHWAPDARG